MISLLATPMKLYQKQKRNKGGVLELVDMLGLDPSARNGHCRFESCLPYQLGYGIMELRMALDHEMEVRFLLP